MRLRRLALLVAVATAALAAFGAASASAGAKFANLTGAQEVPGPGDADGTAAAMINLKPSTAEVCVAQRHAGIDAPTLMHIHSGAAGVAGPIVVNLTTALNGGPACVAADPVVLRDIRSNPTQFYCNIHNGPFPNGAIRGQLEPSS